MENSPGRVLILISAYNEGPRVGPVIAAVRGAVPGARVLVVNDGSTDDTAVVARRAGATVLSHPFNLGAGGARQTGFRYAQRQGYDCVVTLDADGQHEPVDVPRLLEELSPGQVDVALGSRFLGGGTYPTPRLRALGMALIRGLLKLTTGHKLTDPTSGYQALGRRALALYAGPAYPSDYPDAEVLLMVSRAGLRVKEVPVRMYPRSGGQSMFNGVLRPAWYMFKMLLSILVTLLRRPESVTREVQ